MINVWTKITSEKVRRYAQDLSWIGAKVRRHHLGLELGILNGIGSENRGIPRAIGL